MSASEIAKVLTRLIHEIHKKGWSVATGTNYSFRDPNEPSHYWVSESGIDKSIFTDHHFLKVNAAGNLCKGFEDRKASAENLLHALIYKKTKNANVVLHSHSIYNTILSQYFLEQGSDSIPITGYEVQKAIGTIQSHEEEIKFPIFGNRQNMEIVSKLIESRWSACDSAFGFGLGNHGLYTWGKDVPTVKRHLEAYEFLLECIYKSILLKKK